MTAESKIWENLKAEYLIKVEKALSSVKHPHTAGVLEDVQSHLDQRFSELEPDQQTSENFKAIISQMGPASEYAQLLGGDDIASVRQPAMRLNRVVLVLAVVAAVCVGIFIFLKVSTLNLADKPSLSESASDVSIQEPPRVVSTWPQVFANDVSAGLAEIKVTFDRPMMNLSWSWVGGGETFPETTGLPRYDASKTTCTLPVKLLPGRFYWIGINSPRFRNFQTDSGVAAVPYVILFSTKDESGNPTEIPDNYVEEARQINARTR